MKTRLTILLMAALVCAGCTSASRTVTVGFGPGPVVGGKQVVSMTQNTKVSTFLTTVQGFSDSVNADGTSTTAVNNYAGDVQTINALGNIIDSMVTTALVAQGTNVNPNVLSNLFAIKKLHR